MDLFDGRSGRLTRLNGDYMVTILAISLTAICRGMDICHGTASREA